MSPGPTSEHDHPTYAIRVQGRIGPRWSAWFDGLDITGDDDGTTTIRGAVADQAALHGLLQKVRDIGLPILSVTQVEPGPGATPTSTATTEGH